MSLSQKCYGPESKPKWCHRLGGLIHYVSMTTTWTKNYLLTVLYDIKCAWGLLYPFKVIVKRETVMYFQVEGLSGAQYMNKMNTNTSMICSLCSRVWPESSRLKPRSPPVPSNPPLNNHTSTGSTREMRKLGQDGNGKNNGLFIATASSSSLSSSVNISMLLCVSECVSLRRKRLLWQRMRC